MKRLIYPSTTFATGWWAANVNALKADCFVIQLPTGQTLYATEGQWELTVPSALWPLSVGSQKFKALENGVWSRGKITSEAGVRCQANTMTLSCIPKLGSTYPGLSMGLLSAAINHLFDAATVTVFTAYMPFGQYGNVQVLETKFQGTITKAPVIGRLLVQFEVADPFFQMSMKVPSRLLQSNCPWSFADDATGINGRCHMDPANYTVGFTATSASTQTALTPVTAFTQPAGYFAQGVVTCVTGANAGLSATVKSHAAGVVTLVVPWLLPIAAGDTFTVIKGCDQTPTTCASMVRANGTTEPNDWRQRFGGTPFSPPPSTTL